MPQKAVVFGAGNIGRGFIGQIFHKSGFAVSFVDVDASLTALLNSERRYPVMLVDNDFERTEFVENVAGIDGRDADAVAEAIAAADIAATAVGVNNLAKIAPALAEGLKRRIEAGEKPLNIIVCENKIGANDSLRAGVEALLPEETRAALGDFVGFVEVSVGRMVPAPVSKDGEDPLLLRVEPYDKLPFDKSCWRGAAIELAGGVACERFDYYIRHKLFLHNLGHAVTGYLGYLRGFEFIHEAACDGYIHETARAAMMGSAEALEREYGGEAASVRQDAEDLLRRFKNRALRDPIARVCADPMRKLGPGDRLVGAMNNCLKNGADCLGIQVGIAAALLFDRREDPAALEMRQFIKARGACAFLAEHCRIQADNPALQPILSAYSAFKVLL